MKKKGVAQLRMDSLKKSDREAQRKLKKSDREAQRKLGEALLQSVVQGDVDAVHGLLRAKASSDYHRPKDGLPLCIRLLLRTTCSSLRLS